MGPRNILEKNSGADFRVYVVWTDMLVGDGRSKVDVDLMPDPRAAHYWDSERLLGTWFPKQPEYKSVTFGPIAWDTYFLYGPMRNGRRCLSR